MRRFLPALLCALSVAALAAAPALAKDTPMNVLLDGRPLDATTPSGLLHKGTAFINVVRGTKSFSGLLTFGKGDKSVTVTIGARRARFIIGKREATVGGESTALAAAPFSLNGDIYVPLAAFATLAGVTLQVDTKHSVARLVSPGTK
jgi:copper amine oxidase-like protein